MFQRKTNECIYLRVSGAAFGRICGSFSRVRDGLGGNVIQGTVERNAFAGSY